MWVMRFKFAYLQYNYLTGAKRFHRRRRFGMLQTVIISGKAFWPRWICQTGLFNGADLGVASSSRCLTSGRVYGGGERAS
jgi:hypothetical protein